jgi:predicted GNAT superfamily acetyltransferase
MVRHQGLDLITWTFDPLLSQNAYLNLTRLGGVCCTYKRNLYGSMRDGLNANLPSDRFQVDWWVNSQRVQRRLSRRARPPLDLAHFQAAGIQIINPATAGQAASAPSPAAHPIPVHRDGEPAEDLLLLEIPPDFMALKASNPELALEWRLHTRALFEDLFSRGYWATDFVHLPGPSPRSYYVFSHSESTLITKPRQEP